MQKHILFIKTRFEMHFIEKRHLFIRFTDNLYMFEVPQILIAMKNNYSNSSSSDIFCSIFGHNYVKTKDLNANEDELVCKTCQKKFVQKVEDDLVSSPKHEELHSLLTYLITKRKPAANSALY
jgi:hypothetical protein